MARLLLLGIIALPVFVLGCTSAQRQYERGMELEVRGEFAEAAHFYAEAIRRDPDLNRMVYGRLRESARQAIEALVADARANGQAGYWVDAAENYLEADAMVDLGRSVNVEVPTPRRYDESRRETFDAAITALLADGRDDFEHGAFESSIARFELGERYEPSRVQLDELRESEASSRLAWSEELLQSGWYRMAFEVAEVGLGRGLPYASDFQLVQDDALEAGSVRLAALPLQRLRGNTADMPTRFADELSLLMDDEFWIHPPLFVETAAPRDVRSIVRRRLDRDVLVGNPSLTAQIGRDLDSDYALASGMEHFTRAIGEVRVEERTVRLRRGTTYAIYREVRTPTTVRGTIRFEVVDVRTRRVICSDRIERSIRGTVINNEFDGDPRELDLSHEQLARFTPTGVADQERLLHRDLGDELAHALADRVFDCVGSRVR